MSYRADESSEQKAYKLLAIEFVRLATMRAGLRAKIQAEQPVFAYHAYAA